LSSLIDERVSPPYTHDATSVMAEAKVKASSADPVKYLPLLA